MRISQDLFCKPKLAIDCVNGPFLVVDLVTDLREVRDQTAMTRACVRQCATFVSHRNDGNDEAKRDGLHFGQSHKFGGHHSEPAK